MRIPQLKQPPLPLILLSTVGVGAAIAFFKLWTMIPAGHVGVVDTLGQVADQSLPPGIHLRNPLAKIAKFSTQIKEFKETAEAPSKDGLIITVDVSILYRLDPNQIKKLYQTVGDNYEQVILVPYLRSLLRETTANYNAKDLYTTERQAVTNQLRQKLEKVVGDRGILIEDTPIRNIDLPESLQAAIQEKLKAEQESQKMKFILQKEQQEAERKRIEAKGIADSQRIISQGLSAKTLQFRQIEAVEKLAQSQNSKIILLGNGTNGNMIQVQP
jgi:regulator of protease activity HflC (stomatin/prohibitin superfamily)